MRVLQVDSGREWRGGQNQVRLLCRELAHQRDVENSLLTSRGSELASRVKAAGGSVEQTRWNSGLSLAAFLAMGQTVGALQPDIVHVHDSHALTLALWLRKTGPNWLARLISPGMVKWQPYTIVAHRRVDFHVRPGSGWHHADRIIAVSEGVKRVLVADGLDPRDVVVVHDGVDPYEIGAASLGAPDLRKRLGLPGDAPLAVNAGALVDHKDQRTLIRAAAAARPRAPRLHWVIAGEGPLRMELRREIANLGVGDIVHLVGYVEPVDALIKESNVFVMSSREEGMGSVVLHALVLEKPVVATAAGGLPEVVAPEWLTPVGDAAALAAKTLLALEQAPRTSLPERFTAKAMAEAILAQYRVLA